MGLISTWRARRVTASVFAVLTLGVMYQSLAATADAAFMATTQNLNDYSLQSGEQLAPGQSLRAGRFKLVMQTDGNLVEYGDLAAYGLPPRATWWSGTAGHPGAVLRMQTDGNLVIYSAVGAPLWQSRTAGYPGVRAMLLSNGSFVLSSSFASGVRTLPGTGYLPVTREGGVVFSSRLSSGGTLRLPDRLEDPLGRFQLVMQGDGNLVLQAQVRVYNWGGVLGDRYVVDGYRPYWSTSTLVNPGAVARMQADGNLVIYSLGGRVLWQSGTAGHPSAYLVMQQDGNLVIYSTGGRALWHSHTAGAEAPDFYWR